METVVRDLRWCEAGALNKVTIYGKETTRGIALVYSLQNFISFINPSFTIFLFQRKMKYWHLMGKILHIEALLCNNH